MIILTLLNTVHAATNQDFQNLDRLGAFTQALSTVVGSLSTTQIQNTTNAFADGLDGLTQRAQDPTQDRVRLQEEVAQTLARLRQTQEAVAQAQQGISQLQTTNQQLQQTTQQLQQGQQGRNN